MTLLDELREKMADRGIDVYIVPTDDFHGSEYVGDYFKSRAYLTGFTGSAGTAFVTETEAGLFTDGRYFLQAERELQGSGFKLYRMREKGVPTLLEKIESILPEGGVIGYDGRVMAADYGRKLEIIAKKKGGRVESSYDLVDLIWPDRPERSAEKIWILPERFAGESAADKLSRVRTKMAEAGADTFVLASLTDIAWLLNLRGNDTENCPVALAYFVMTADSAVLYIQEEAVTEEAAEKLAAAGVSFAPYDSVYSVAEEIRGQRVLLSPETVNDRLYRILSAGNRIIARENPTLLMKAVKNETEVRNMRMAQIKDNVAVTKWIRWLKKTVGTCPLTEMSVSKKLLSFRENLRGFLGESFETIAGYKEHGAIIHYAATPETDKELRPESLLLVDTGGNYAEGSTDITRTVALGPLTQEEKEMFTLVLRSHLSLMDLKFRKGCTGLNFDILAREPFWERGLDYRHGTGHGIGYLLAIHEGPNGFRYQSIPERKEEAILEPGMITTDEPGIYIEGKFGIRIENELLCRKWMETEYGEFLTLEPITFIPIDLDAVLPERLNEAEKEKLNRYHEKVFAELSPYLTKEETSWLREATRRI